MKRITSALVLTLLFVFLLFNVGANAASFAISGTDISVEVDDAVWYVFTRDNIKDNPELEELGLTYEYMNGVFNDNKAYMDAVLFYDDGNFMELLIRKTESTDGTVNLSNYSDDEVLDLAKTYAEKVGAKDYSVYKTQQKFAKVDYYDANYKYYMSEYITVVNKDIYVVTFQSTVEYDEEMNEEIAEILESVRFDVDTSLKEKSTAKDSFFDIVMGKSVRGGIIGALVGAVVAFITKKIKKPKKAASEPVAEAPEQEPEAVEEPKDETNE